MDEERLEGAVRAVRRICEGVVNQGGSWSADAVTLAKALSAITRNVDRVEMYPERVREYPKEAPCRTE